MSLVVSLRIPDGVVIAADSLATTQQHIAAAKASARCPHCDQPVEIPLDVPPIAITASTFSFAQKVFPFRESFGIGTFGLGIVNQRTIYHHTRELEQRKASQRLQSVTAVANRLAKYFHAELRKEAGERLRELPDDQYVLGLHVVGYDQGQPKTKVVNVGKRPVVSEYAGIGCTVGGESRVATQLWAIGQGDPRQLPFYSSFSLQDAIDYAKFLIRTTADYQRFANMIPTVGGEVDIGLITPYRPFTWIESKALTRKVEEGRYDTGG